MGMGTFRNDNYESTEVTPSDGDSFPADQEGGVWLWGTQNYIE